VGNHVAKRKILVVDKDLPYARRVVELLCSAGYDTLATPSARDAIAAVSTSRPDLALVDVGLTDDSGLALSASLRSKFSLPLIILSRLDDAEAALQATQIGAHSYLPKSEYLHHYLPTVHAVLACSHELHESRQREEHLAKALQQKRAISAAMGVLMERSSLSRGHAFERLRGIARAQRRRLSDVAEQLLVSVECLNGVIGTEPRAAPEALES
jgi:DNA-binding response OmpR family regulator